MPVTLVDRLPLPNLKVYSAGSVLLVSVAVYYALNVTSDPSWRGNGTLARGEPAPGGEAGLAPAAAEPAPPLLGPRNLTEQLADVISFMMQEPLCMWTAVNMAYCVLAVAGCALQHAVFGALRVAEAQRLKDKFWNYVFYKFIFVFGVINVQYMHEVLLWCAWFSLLAALHLLAQLCKDRFEYLTSSPGGARWAHVRLSLLLGGILAAGGALLGVALLLGLPHGPDTFAFMAAECVLVLVSALHVCARYALAARGADPAAPLAYYTQLVFDSGALVVELAHVVHMVVYSNLLVTMTSLVLLMQLRHLLHELQARLQRHRQYTERATHITRTCPMASKEEVEKNQDNCAICWEPMQEARKLPCAHLFHNSCLCRWVQQDASCPTCRRALARRAPEPPAPPAPADTRNRLFHFNGSRYVSWLPNLSVEVRRAHVPSPAQLDAMARQVHQLFPQYPLPVLRAELAQTRSATITLDNILEGRLLPPDRDSEPETPVAAPEPAPAPAPAPATTPVALPDPPLYAPSEVEASGQTPGSVSSEQFPGSAAERERELQQRKARLVAAARARYMARRAAPASPHT